MTTLDFGPTTTALATLVRAVGDDQLDGPTPNTGRSVGDLLDHIGGLALAFTAAARKEEPPGGGNPTADATHERREGDGGRAEVESGHAGPDLTSPWDSSALSAVRGPWSGCDRR